MIVNVDNWPNIYQECPTILLDGKVIDHVIEADDQEGCVVVYDELAMIGPLDRVPTLRLYGSVKIQGKLQPWVQ